MKRFISLTLLICTFFTASSQVQTDYVKLKKHINRNLSLLGDHESSITSSLDYDSLAQKTAQQLTRLLKFEEARNLDVKEFHNLTLSAQSNDSLHIRIFTFVYVCGGTKGGMDYPVIQWCNKQGQLFACNLSRNILLSFDPVITLLKRDTVSSLYLLTGTESDNATHGTSAVLVLKFKGDLLFTNYPAFANQYGLTFTNVSISYDPKYKMLHLHPYNAFSITGYRISENPDDTTGNYKIDHLLNDNYFDPHYGFAESADLWFNGTRFVNRTQPAKPGEN
jgi:hypothetical protein